MTSRDSPQCLAFRKSVRYLQASWLDTLRQLDRRERPLCSGSKSSQSRQPRKWLRLPRSLTHRTETKRRMTQLDSSCVQLETGTLPTGALPVTDEYWLGNWYPNDDTAQVPHHRCHAVTRESFRLWAHRNLRLVPNPDPWTRGQTATPRPPGLPWYEPLKSHEREFLSVVAKMLVNDWFARHHRDGVRV